jgi:predicted ATPase/signal transduction histidine kinase/tRNA A-37 threonylcarbamoyl transferase component Bud32
MITIANYQITEQIYESANSLIYRGRRHDDNQPVILKMLKENYPTPEELTRYRQEYEITKSLNLDGVIKTYDLKKSQNTLVIVLEDFGGESLKQLMTERGLTVKEFLPLAIQIADSLGLIHAANIIHKDINPSNLVFNPNTNQLKMIDFGIATVLPRENPLLKNPNQLEGTLAYISPEQTGRMNRALDYRTDLYSLGLTFYEMLTGQLPFNSDSPMELVHCHLAKTPAPVSEINSSVPQVLSEMVMKLMAKNVEERYQSAFGVKADLEKCVKNLGGLDSENLSRFQNLSRLTFELAQNDFSGRFQIPQKLYGRETEVNTLLQAFERLTEGGKNPTGKGEMILVSGYSGVGKTALVHEVHKPMTEKHGHFAAGKFDQYQRNIPYSALTQAFNNFCNYLLTESTEELIRWRDKILTAVGNNGQVLIEVIAQLELIIGPQPAVAQVGLQEAQNRFNLVFHNFFQAICQKEHPLVLFIDDLQWADSASLALLKLLMTDTNNQYFLIIGAYRDNEVDAAHPLMTTIEELKNDCKVSWHEIRLQNLSHQHVNTLIADALKCGPYDATALTDLVYEKTQGNAFFTHEFLKSLSEKSLLVFDFKTQKWQWAVDKIAALEMTDNVVELMADKIAQLSEETQTALKLAACIGNQFDLKTLSVIGQHLQTTTLALLFEAIKESLLLPLDENYKRLAEIETGETDSRFKFQHDRVQQAAYALIDESQKPVVHLSIGQLLLANISIEDRTEKIFEIVDHLNVARELITKPVDKIELAQLNLEAGKKAKEATAYVAALKYLKVGMESLTEQHWSEHYDLSFALYKERAALEYLSGNFSQSETFLNLLLAKAQTALEKADIYNKLVVQYTMIGRYEEAIEFSRKGLQFLEKDLPKDNVQVVFESIHVKIQNQLKDMALFSIINQSEIADTKLRVVIQLLHNTLAPAILSSNIFLYGFISAQMTLISFKEGILPELAIGYSGYGLVLSSVLNDYQMGYHFGQLGMKVSQKYNDFSQISRTFMIFANCIAPWKVSFRAAPAINQEGYHAGLECGDLQFAGYNLEFGLTGQFYAGKNLSDLQQEISASLAFFSKTKHQQALNDMLGLQLGISNLCGLTEENLSVNDHSINEANYLKACHDNQAFLPLCNYYVLKSQILYYYGKLTDSLQCVLLAEKRLGYIVSMIPVSEHNFYHSLILTGLYLGGSEAEQQQYWETLEVNQQQLKRWANHCPENFRHKYLLVEAEMARVSGNNFEAIALYDQAIASARENEFIQNEALANELAAKFWLEKGQEEIAGLYLKKAHYGYHLWGAISKVEDLEQKYPQLLAQKISKTMPTMATVTLGATIMASTSQLQSASTWLDFDSVMKAAQTLSGEIVLSQLLEKMMHTVIENAGAQRGLLILEKGKGTWGKEPSESEWVIEAQAAIDEDNVSMLQSIELDKALVSPEIVHYVLRTQQQVVLNDATAQGPFTQTTYVKKTQPKSILCLPLINQGQINGILYLENNLTTGAFTPERLSVLKLLSSQMAISLENAFIYNHLEELVAERTQELTTALDNLKATQNQLIESEKMAALGGLVAGVAHEINTPVGVGITAASTLDKETQAFVEQFNQGKLKRSALQAYLDTAQQGSQLILSNLQQAAELVQSFKQVAVDQTHLARRQFAVKAYIEETILNLMPKLKQTKHRLTINGDDTVTINSYPGALSQVVNNLVTNSIAHAYQPGESGQLHFYITAHDSKLTIEYHDDGCGIAPENLSKIFEPFFTTARNQGGSGLGLHIVYNLITQKLKGTIRCKSRMGEGTIFIIELPIP